MIQYGTVSPHRNSGRAAYFGNAVSVDCRIIDVYLIPVEVRKNIDRYIYIYEHVYVWVYVYAYAYVYVDVDVYVYVYLLVFVHVFVHVYINMCIYIYDIYQMS